MSNWWRKPANSGLLRRTSAVLRRDFGSTTYSEGLVMPSDTQVMIEGPTYLPAVSEEHEDTPPAFHDPEEGTMTYWLAVAAKEVRQRARRKPVHVAARLDRDQNTIYRFESHVVLPHKLDMFIAAYAEECGVRPTEIWRRGAGSVDRMRLREHVRRTQCTARRA